MLQLGSLPRSYWKGTVHLCTLNMNVVQPKKQKKKLKKNQLLYKKGLNISCRKNNNNAEINVHLKKNICLLVLMAYSMSVE